MIGRYGLHTSIVDIETTLGRLLEDRIPWEDEGIVEVTPDDLPSTRRRIIEHSTHAIVAGIIPHTEVAREEGRHEVIVRRTMAIALSLRLGKVDDEWHTELMGGEVPIMSPVVTPIFIELLPMVSADDHEGILQRSRSSETL